jgi:pre-mRNA cleavage complex 2 protein Pcf11
MKKLPAFYVLDSVVKNVGTPYTLFFGRQLYSTFMEAYALVDNSTRRKMDEMLKTWKEPVPGSMDTRPVFPPEITRPIENALIKARTSALQQEQMRSQQQGYGRGRPIQAPYRDNPTPPGAVRLTPHQALPGYTVNYIQQQHPPPSVGPQAYILGSSQQNPTSAQAYPPTHSHYPPNGQPYPVPSQQYPSTSQQYPTSNHQLYPSDAQSNLSNNLHQHPPPDTQQYANYPNGHQPLESLQVGD